MFDPEDAKLFKKKRFNANSSGLMLNVGSSPSPDLRAHNALSDSQTQSLSPFAAKNGAKLNNMSTEINVV